MGKHSDDDKVGHNRRHKGKPKKKHPKKLVHDDDDYNITDDHGDDYYYNCDDYENDCNTWGLESAEFQLEDSSSEASIYQQSSFIGAVAAVGMVVVVGAVYTVYKVRNNGQKFEALPTESVSPKTGLAV